MEHDSTNESAVACTPKTDSIRLLTDRDETVVRAERGTTVVNGVLRHIQIAAVNVEKLLGACASYDFEQH